MIRTNGRTALVILAGLLLLFAGAAQAAPSSKPDGASKQSDAAKPVKQRRHTSHRATSSKTAQKPSADKANKTEAAAVTDEAKADAKAGNDKAGNDAPASSLMPPQVANANAQLAAADTPTAAAASAMTSRAADNVQAAADNGTTPEAPAAAPDPSSDVGRAQNTAQDTAQNTPAPKAVIAATDAPPRPAPVLAASVQQGSAWDQSSLIGKIFIGFGALLTLASAARMFMA